MISKTTQTIAAVAVFSAIMVLPSLALPSWADAQGGNENGTGSLPGIGALKQESLLNGQIFDRYLIPYEKSQAKIEGFGGIEQAREMYTHMNDLLDESKGNEYMEKFNHGTMLIHNFHTLTNTTEDVGRVAALVISERMQNEAYRQPEIEPLQTLHGHLIAEYPTAGNAEETLTGLFGEMKILAPEMLEVLEMYTLFGKPPSELYFADVDYWATVGAYGDCVLVEEGSDCDKYLEIARERPWDQLPPEDARHIDPPGEVLPIIPESNASHALSVSYSPIKYHAEVYTYHCQEQGAECIYYKKKGTSNGYKSLSYAGTDHVVGKYVVAYMRTAPTSDDAYYALALSEHWPGGAHKAKLATAHNGNAATASQHTKIGNSHHATITYDQGARFTGYAIE